jgi:hypothetical protein
MSTQHHQDGPQEASNLAQATLELRGLVSSVGSEEVRFGSLFATIPIGKKPMVNPLPGDLVAMTASLRHGIWVVDDLSILFRQSPPPPSLEGLTASSSEKISSGSSGLHDTNSSHQKEPLRSDKFTSMTQTSGISGARQARPASPLAAVAGQGPRADAQRGQPATASPGKSAVGLNQAARSPAAESRPKSAESRPKFKSVGLANDDGVDDDLPF